VTRNFKLTVEYDGGAYHGWQRQASEPTVQAAIEAALRTMTGSPVTVVGSGRTDAGVHALGQVAHFRCETRIPPEAIRRGLNALLPADIVVHACTPVPETFHARHDARKKVYQYRILNREIPAAVGRGYLWHVRRPLDPDSMRLAAEPLVGTLDFKSFEGAGSPRRSTVRTVYRAEWTVEPGDRLIFEIEGNGFLRYMVRNIVGTLVWVGMGRMRPGQMGGLIEARSRDLAPPTAPAQGLFLKEVHYAGSDPGDRGQG
jgi:tRNA pseudouridine38-40 synthase